jgi:hypothetical protein
VPPSGSLFPVGLTPVHVQAGDTAGNIAQCLFAVTVLGAKGIKSNLLAELVSIRANTVAPSDCWELDEAIEDMIDALGLDNSNAPGWVRSAHRPQHCRNHHRRLQGPLWLDENRVVPDNAWWVFACEKHAAKELDEITKSKKRLVSETTARKIIDRLVKCDRLLAVVKIQEATKAGAKQKRINQASAELTQADRDAAAGRPATAIGHYWRAWSFASWTAVDSVRSLDH